jgi:hypothetical protein
MGFPECWYKLLLTIRDLGICTPIVRVGGSLPPVSGVGSGGTYRTTLLRRVVTEGPSAPTCAGRRGAREGPHPRSFGGQKCLSHRYDAVPVRIVRPNRVHLRCRRSDAREGPAVDPGTRRGSEVPRYPSSPPRAQPAQSSMFAAHDAGMLGTDLATRARAGARNKRRPSRPVRSTFADTTRRKHEQYQALGTLTTGSNTGKGQDLSLFTVKHSRELDIMALIRSYAPTQGRSVALDTNVDRYERIFTRGKGRKDAGLWPIPGQEGEQWPKKVVYNRAGRA